MSNMSYCRFENTLHDVQDCIEVLSGESDTISSKSEKKCAQEMIDTVVGFLVEHKLVETVSDYEDLIEEVIANVCEPKLN